MENGLRNPEYGIEKFTDGVGIDVVLPVHTTKINSDQQWSLR